MLLSLTSLGLSISITLGYHVCSRRVFRRSDCEKDASHTSRESPKRLIRVFRERDIIVSTRRASGLRHLAQFVGASDTQVLHSFR
uniref:Putative secreted protein n=1 Tax=Anopheles darlingi TaxID=43151 RepID=A0A2M4DGL5_ANODA